MNSKEIYTIALGLVSPWEISDIRIEETAKGDKEFHIEIKFKRGKDELCNASVGNGISKS